MAKMNEELGRIATQPGSRAKALNRLRRFRLSALIPFAFLASCEDEFKDSCTRLSDGATFPANAIGAVGNRRWEYLDQNGIRQDITWRNSHLWECTEIPAPPAGFKREASNG